MLNNIPSLPGLGLDDSINYEKRIAIYSSFGQENWSISKRRVFLNDCMKDYPTRSFAWIKAMEEVLNENDKTYFDDILKKLESTNINDHRIHIMLSLAYESFGNNRLALWHANTSVHMTRYDTIPIRIATRMYCRIATEQEAFTLMMEAGMDSMLGCCSVSAWLKDQPIDLLPLYYNY